MAVAMGVIWVAGVWEWTRFAGSRIVPPALYTVFFIALMLASGWLLDNRYAQWVAAISMLWWLLAIIAMCCYKKKIPAMVVAISGPFALLPAWLLLVYIHGAVPDGPAITLSALIIVWAADIGAYFFGRRYGRVKLAPRISPGKSWEGVLGGVSTAVVAATAAGVALGAPLGAFISIALAAVLISIVGDLTFSMFKRNVGIKDSGRLLPGHGGVLDRIDSLAAAVPLFFIGLSAVGLLG